MDKPLHSNNTALSHTLVSYKCAAPPCSLYSNKEKKLWNLLTILNGSEQKGLSGGKSARAFCEHLGKIHKNPNY